MSLTVEKIVQIVSQKTGVTYEEMRDRQRTRRKVEARMLAAYLAKLFIPNVTLKALGIYLGGRDHSTIIHYINSIEDYIDTSEYWEHKVNKYCDIIQSYLPGTVANIVWEFDSTI